MLAQIGAEALGVPFENVLIDTGDTDTGPHCMGTFASRTTHRAGNAIIMAAPEAKKTMLEIAADELEARPDDLETDGQGFIRVKGSPDRKIDLVNLALAGHFKYGKTVAGRGIFFKPNLGVDPETGKMDPDSTEAHACVVAEVEVDTETGDVKVLSLQSVYEIGRQVNPKLVEGQIRGGSVMGMGHALYESTEPYYPEPRAPRRAASSSTSCPLAPDVPEMEIEVLEYPSDNGPYGVKGFGEMTANAPIPAIVNAINNALGTAISCASGDAGSGTAGAGSEASRVIHRPPRHPDAVRRPRRS